MSFFVQSTASPKPKTKNVQAAALILASMLTLMVVAQLFTYEDFPGVVVGFGMIENTAVNYLLAALVVTGEVFALPFLLGMRVSPLMRVVSMVAGWFVLAFWLIVAIWQNIAPGSSGSGVLGATVNFPVGPWMISFFLGLAVLAVWASWGMWPKADFKRVKQTGHKK